MKNPNNYGGIVDLGKGRRKPLGVRVPIGKKLTPDKREIPQYKYIGYFEKTPQGKKQALQLLADYNAGKAISEYSSDCPTFREVYDEWLDRHLRHLEATKGSYSDVLVKSYGTAINKFTAIFGKRIDTVKLQDIQDIVDGLSHLSKQANQNVGIVLKGLFQLAKKQGFIENNFFEDIEFFGKTSHEQMHTDFSEEEIQKLWDNQDDEVVQIALVLIYTGMRINELIKIRIEDIDFTEQYVIGGSKTTAGKDRIIPFCDKIMPIIKSRTGEYLFEINGRQIVYNTFFKWYWNPTMERLGLNHRIHDTRVTCATMLDRAKVPQNVIKEILGHTQNDVTNSVYIRKSAKDLLEAINNI